MPSVVNSSDVGGFIVVPVFGKPGVKYKRFAEAKEKGRKKALKISTASTHKSPYRWSPNTWHELRVCNKRPVYDDLSEQLKEYSFKDEEDIKIRGNEFEDFLEVLESKRMYEEFLKEQERDGMEYDDSFLGEETPTSEEVSKWFSLNDWVFDW